MFFSSRALLNTSLCGGLSLLALTPACVLADTTDNLMNRSTLTGDWGGERQKLIDKGIKLTGDYNSETFSNLHGGIKHGTRYSQQVRIGAQFDLSKILGSADAGLVQITVNDRRGHSASEDLVGNRLPIQENAGGNYTRLSEFSYQRTLFSEDLTTKLGCMPMGNEFGGMPLPLISPLEIFAQGAELGERLTYLRQVVQVVAFLPTCKCLLEMLLRLRQVV